MPLVHEAPILFLQYTACRSQPINPPRTPLNSDWVPDTAPLERFGRAGSNRCRGDQGTLQSNCTLG
jgi:hypothetical protein